MTATTKISYEQAVAEAIRMEMHRDPNVVCVTGHGQSERSPVVRELAGAFGVDRVTELPAHVRPLSVAAGMAARGLRAVCEVRAAELGPDALAPLEELHPGAEGGVLLRVPADGPDLAQLPAPPIEGRLLDVAGLPVVVPATPADAKGMLVACLRRAGGTCVLEPEPLYASVGDVPEGSHEVDPATARIERGGRRPKVSVVAYGAGAQAASHALGLASVSAELVDLRSLRPLDADAVVASLGRTGKLAVVEPAGRTRVGAEVAALAMERGFELLDGPLARIELDPGADPDAMAAAIAARVDELAVF